MNQLILENNYSWLKTTEDFIRHDLWKKLRFREKNYFHSRLYKQKLWDGYKEFFIRESGRFLTGLLPEVQAYLAFHQIPYSIEDRRNQIQWLYPKIDENFLNQWLDVFNARAPKDEQKKNFVLRDYQPDLVNTIIKYNRGLVIAPTAAGKTAIMISIIKALPKTSILILTKRSSLSHQNYKQLDWWGCEDLGQMYDKYNKPNLITVANWQSIHKIKSALPKFKVLIVDEIHEMMSAGPKKIYNKMESACVRVGISATPFKFGGSDKTQKYSVKGYFGPEMKVKSAGEKGILTTAELQRRKILPPARCIFYPIREPQLPYAVYQDAVTLGIAENWHFHKIVQKLATSLQGRTLILVDRLAHGDYLESLIPGSLWVRGQDNQETREYVIDKLKKSKENTIAIATQGIFNAGIDVFVHNLINAASGQADHQIIQRIGRGLRAAPDKEMLNYFDFVFEINDYLLQHSQKRIRILSAEKHEVIVKQEIDF